MKKIQVILIVIASALLTTVLSDAASVSLTVSVNGGAVTASVSGTFAECAGSPGSVRLQRDGEWGDLCDAIGTGKASCTRDLDRGSLNGSHRFDGAATDCTGDVVKSYYLTLDNTPSLVIMSPPKTVSGPFNMSASATFMPSINPVNSLYCVLQKVGEQYVYIDSNMSKTCYSETCSLSYLEFHGDLWHPGPLGQYNFFCTASGGGATTHGVYDFEVVQDDRDRVPSEMGGEQCN
jgi:hypothetical protein